jgi:hypothetical protein
MARYSSEGLAGKIGVGYAGVGQGLMQLHLGGYLGGENDEIRGQGQYLLKIGLLHGAHDGDVLAQIQIPLVHGVLGGAHQRAAGEHPGLGKAAVQGHHPVVAPRFTAYPSASVKAPAGEAEAAGEPSLPPRRSRTAGPERQDAASTDDNFFTKHRLPLPFYLL